MNRRCALEGLGPDDLPETAGGDELGYSFDVGDGRYLVNLLFMNGQVGTGASGDRVFDIAFGGAGGERVPVAGGESTAPYPSLRPLRSHRGGQP